MGEPGERAYRNQEDMENGIVKCVGCRGGMAIGGRSYDRPVGLGTWIGSSFHETGQWWKRDGGGGSGRRVIILFGGACL